MGALAARIQEARQLLGETSLTFDSNKAEQAARMLKADLFTLVTALSVDDLPSATNATRELTLSLSMLAKALGAKEAVNHYRQAFNALGKAQPITVQAEEASTGAAEEVLDILSNAMDILDRANTIVMHRQGNITQTDKRPLMQLAQALESAAADMMMALRNLQA